MKQGDHKSQNRTCDIHVLLQNRRAYDFPMFRCRACNSSLQGKGLRHVYVWGHYLLLIYRILILYKPFLLSNDVLSRKFHINSYSSQKKIISGSPDVNLELPDTEMTLHRLFLACHSEHNSVQPEGMPHQGLILWCEITVLRELNYRSFFELLYLYIFFALSCLYSFAGECVCEECYWADKQ